MRKFSTPAVFTLHVALAAALLCAFSGVQAKAPPVGEVTLTIGRAMVISSTGESEVAQRGSKIQSGDRVETSDGGHVHIRFIDGATWIVAGAHDTLHGVDCVASIAASQVIS